jgi:hypothetical protein
MVNKLKEENKRLNDSLAQNNSMLKQNDQLVIKQEELDYIRQIKEENIKLKEANRSKDREIEQKLTETEAVSPSNSLKLNYSYLILLIKHLIN